MYIFLRVDQSITILGFYPGFEGNSVLGNKIAHRNASAWSKCTKECCKSQKILADDFTANGNFFALLFFYWTKEIQHCQYSIQQVDS